MFHVRRPDRVRLIRTTAPNYDARGTTKSRQWRTRLSEAARPDRLCPPWQRTTRVLSHQTGTDYGECGSSSRFSPVNVVLNARSCSHERDKAMTSGFGDIVFSRI